MAQLCKTPASTQITAIKTEDGVDRCNEMSLMKDS
jgi:hypothetical protein